MESTLEYTCDDIAYVEEHFMCLHARPAQGPAPSYVLPDGSAFYPADYFDLETDEARFKARLCAEMQAQELTSLDPDEVWQTYMQGVYGVCLHSATPENIARKNALLERIETLTSAPREDDPVWLQAVRQAVDALDALERPFSPHYDRARFGKPPTRDSHIRDVRRRFHLH
ncbi:MAG TPA: DUF6058 family natural product biosynthesis protein [Candidatus Baltobacteraceae bacterium]|nr:DUF6058 family natural product biosynthesis protein [Candidatus Baltobacteraceae bacterium]